jgi:cation diffusion facilitator CzcD-associated flavoprotein CzcO
VELEDGTVERFDAVIAATGHLSEPLHVPMFRDDFAGTYVHSHDYKEPEDYVGQRICVVGVGNSACDIASDVCVTSPRCVLVARSGVIILPKLFCGIPFTDITRMIQRPWVPGWLRRKLTAILTFLVHGNVQKLGFRPVSERVHTTSNGTIVTDIAYKRVEVKHEIDRIDGKTLYFSDGTSEEFDTIIAATGYQIRLPFISRDIVPLENNRLRLYKRMVQPGWPGLYFAGFFNTDTALNMVFEHQARWIRAVELGEAALPGEAEMWADIEAQERWVAARFKDTLRHTIEEEHVVYLGALRKSLRLMKRLARRYGNRTLTPQSKLGDLSPQR